MLTLLVSTSVMAQAKVLPDSTLTSYQATIVSDSTKLPTEEIAYVTPDRDTMYVVVDMYPLISKIWDESSNIDEKPVLIPVTSITELKQSLVAKRED